MEDKNIGLIIVGFLVVVVGLALWSALSPPIGTLTQTFTATNASFTAPAVNVIGDLIPCGQLNTSAVVIYNATNGTAGHPITVLGSGYKVSQGAGADGFLSALINVTNTTYAGKSTLTVTCDYQNKGYVNDGGTRNLVLLIPIFFAILIAFSVMPDLREWIKGLGS